MTTCPHCSGPVTLAPANDVDDGERVRRVERAVMACEECGAVVDQDHTPEPGDAKGVNSESTVFGNHDDGSTRGDGCHCQQPAHA